jgi:hypothetical protein
MQVAFGTLAFEAREPAVQWQSVEGGTAAFRDVEAGSVRGRLFPQVGSVAHWLRENEQQDLNLTVGVLGVGTYPYDLEIQTLSELDTYLRSNWRLYTADRTVFSWPLFMGSSPFWYLPKRWTADDEGTVTCDQAMEAVDTADIERITIDSTEDRADQGWVYFDDDLGQPTTDSTMFDWSQEL